MIPLARNSRVLLSFQGMSFNYQLLSYQEFGASVPAPHLTPFFPVSKYYFEKHRDLRDISASRETEFHDHVKIET